MYCMLLGVSMLFLAAASYMRQAIVSVVEYGCFWDVLVWMWCDIECDIR
jgi:hypothetical protein